MKNYRPIPPARWVISIIYLLSLAILPNSAIPSKRLGRGHFRCQNSGRPTGDPDNCRQYYTCVNGVKISSLCPAGYIFDSSKLECVKSAIIPCSATKRGRSQLGKRCTSTGEIIPSEIACDRFLICRSGRYHQRNCPFGTIFSNQNYKCIVPPNPCPTQAHKDIIKTELMTLGFQKFDSPYIGLCDAKFNEYVAEPFDCSMYVECREDKTDPTNIGGVNMVFTECPKGMLFSAQLKICTDPKTVFCDTRYRIVNLYGNDTEPNVPQGRAFGRTHPSRPKARTSHQPANPKFGPNPGVYRAIYKNKPTPKPITTKPTTKAVPFAMKTTIHYGFLIQAPGKMEIPMVKYLAPVSGKQKGRDFSRSNNVPTISKPVVPVPPNNNTATEGEIHLKVHFTKSNDGLVSLHKVQGHEVGSNTKVEIVTECTDAVHHSNGQGYAVHNNAQPQAVHPVAQPQAVHPIPQPQAVYPVAQPQAVHPVPQPQAVYPVAQPQAVHPVAQPQVVYPVAQPQAVHPVPQPQAVYPVPQPQAIHPVAQPQAVHPVAQPQVVYPVAQPQPVYPVAQPQPVYPVAQPQAVHPVAQPQAVYPVAQPQPVHPVPQLQAVQPNAQEQAVQPDVQNQEHFGMGRALTKAKIVKSVMDRFSYHTSEEEYRETSQFIKPKRSRPRVGESASFLEDYLSTVLSRTMNSTKEDQIFYKDDYYAETSEEKLVVQPASDLRIPKKVGGATRYFKLKQLPPQRKKVNAARGPLEEPNRNPNGVAPVPGPSAPVPNPVAPGPFVQAPKPVVPVAGPSAPAPNHSAPVFAPAAPTPNRTARVLIPAEPPQSNHEKLVTPAGVSEADKPNPFPTPQ